MSEIEKYKHYNPETIKTNQDVESEPADGRETENKDNEQDIREKVSSWSRQWLDDYYLNITDEESQDLYNEENERFGFRNDVIIEHKLADLAGDGDKYNQGFFGRGYRIASGVFLEELINFVQKKSLSADNKENLTVFLEKIQNLFFSHSPNLASNIGAFEGILLTAKANRVPEIQGWFGQTMVGEMTYNINFGSRENFESIVERSKHLKTGDLLDFLHQVQTIAANSASADWSNYSYDNLVALVKEIKDKSNPLINIVADLILERLSAEAHNPSLGFVKRYGDQGEGKVREGLSQEQVANSNNLLRQIKMDIDLPSGGKVLQVAKDAIAVFDHSNLPRYLSITDLASLPPPAEASYLHIERAREAATVKNLGDMHRLFQIIDYMNNNILNSSQNDNESFVKSWAEISDTISKDEWKIFFESRLQYEKIIQEMQIQEDKIVEEIYNQPDKEPDGAEKVTDPVSVLSNRLALNQDKDELVNKRIAEFRDSSGYEEKAHNFLREYLEIAQKLSAGAQKLSNDIGSYVDNIKNNINNSVASVHFENYEKLNSNEAINPYLNMDKESGTLLLQHLHRPGLTEKISKDIGIDIRQIPVRSQIHLLRFLAEAGKEDYGRIMAASRNAGEARDNFFETFLVVSEDMDYARNLMDLVRQLKEYPELVKKVFDSYISFVDISYSQAGDILAECQSANPNITMGRDMIVQSLLSRAKDFLIDTSQAIANGKNPEQVIGDMIAELESEKKSENVIRSRFKNIASLLDRKDIDLGSFETDQDFNLKTLLANEDAKGATFRVLSRMGKLAPVPEIHWRVDRNLEEYERRFGIDLDGFLEARAKEKNNKQVLLEIGPGSGVGKKERAGLNLSSDYQDFALSDKIYFPLAGLVEKLINFQKLEKDLEIELSQDMRTQLADFVYKTLVIKKEQTSQDRFEYDDKITKMITDDVNLLKQAIPGIGEKIDSAKVVPSTISSRNDKGDVIYPYKIDANKWPQSMRKAKDKLGSDFSNYLIENWQNKDFYELIDAFPANVMLGDLRQIEKLKDNQIDVELAVRSTVYARDEDYVNFMRELVDKVKDEGIVCDDSVRDNDGWYYRLAELFELKKATKDNLEIIIMLGPGFPGEDYRSNDAPMSMYITKNGQSYELLSKFVLPEFKLKRLEDLIFDGRYLKSLDPQGATYKKVNEVLRDFRRV